MFEYWEFCPSGRVCVGVCESDGKGVSEKRGSLSLSNGNLQDHIHCTLSLSLLGKQE